MQAIRQRYNCLAVGFYNFWRQYVTRFPTAPYEVYTFRMIQSHFPKLSYESTFEPAYTQPLVKYNAHICLTLIAVTLFASHRAVAQEEENAKHRT